jgi:hypothetical protein
MTRDPLNVLVVSHAAVIGVNQVPFDALARDGARVAIVAPSSLRTDLRGRVEFEARPGSAARTIPLPVSLGGYRAALGGQRGIHVIVYRGLARAIAAAAPDVVFVEEEPHSFAARQVARTGIRFVVHENQNIARRLPPPFGSIRRAVLASPCATSPRSSWCAHSGSRGRSACSRTRPSHLRRPRSTRASRILSWGSRDGSSPRRESWT